jgi:hypothetical protein
MFEQPPVKTGQSYRPTRMLLAMVGIPGDRACFARAPRTTHARVEYHAIMESCSGMSCYSIFQTSCEHVLVALTVCACRAVCY